MSYVLILITLRILNNLKFFAPPVLKSFTRIYRLLEYIVINSKIEFLEAQMKSDAKIHC